MTACAITRFSDCSGGVSWSDAPPVRAALRGRVLLLDGLERAERNVLPTLNNLLENRELSLDDGRLLVEARRLTAMVSDGARFAGVDPLFRVIALAAPAPPFDGRPEHRLALSEHADGECRGVTTDSRAVSERSRQWRHL